MIQKLIFFSLFLLSLSTFADSKKRILILGDSLTAGYGIAQKDAFPKQMEILLQKKHPNIEVINAGSSGSTTASGPGRMQWHLKAKPDILILALGANDGLRGLPVKDAQDNLQKVIDIAKQNGIKVIIAGMKIPMNYGEDYRQSFEKIFVDLASKNKIPSIPFLLKDVASIQDLNQADGIHPNEEGHKIMAKTVAEVVEKDL